ncbi:hypothetical protein BBP40_001402 [Aspergillus hancockii]|nr:hypothetical protein BBP40_001402 [Aspergillus hancockii]
MKAAPACHLGLTYEYAKRNGVTAIGEEAVTVGLGGGQYCWRWSFPAEQKGVETFMDSMEAFDDAGPYGYYYLGASAIEIVLTILDRPTSISHGVLIAPNMTIAETQGAR